MHSNISNVCVSWDFQNVTHNLQIRFPQFTDQKKVWYGTNTTNRTFYKQQYYKVSNAYVTGHLRSMLYDSKTQIIQFTNWKSGWKSPLNNLQTK